jgi:anaerobic magnesium-protoporphyrin IX monomethyl ester cyclase
VKVLLVQMWLGRSEKPIYPIGLATLAGALNGHDVRLLDPNILPDPLVSLEQELSGFQPDVVGLSLRNVDTTQFRDPFAYIKTLRQTLAIIKRIAPQAKRVIGGSGFSVHAQSIMERYRDLDFGIPLEGEEAFPELLDHLDLPEKVAGIYVRNGDSVRSTESRPLPTQDQWHQPRWELWDPKQYIHDSATVGIETKRGCALNCVYCTYGYLNGKCYRLRDPRKVVDEIQRLWEKFGVPEIMFVDSVFNYPKDHAEAICRELLKRDLPLRWSAWLHEKDLDQDFLELLVAAGCYEVSFSPDGYTDRSLKRLGKDMTKDDIRRAYQLVREIPRLRVGYNFFANPPGQTLGGFVSLLGFFLKARWQLRGRWNGFLLGKIRIEPHTAVFNLAVKEGVITQKTNLLPDDDGQLIDMFYTPPNHRLIESLYKGYVALWKFKHRHDGDGMPADGHTPFAMTDLTTQDG